MSSFFPEKKKKKERKKEKESLAQGVVVYPSREGEKKNCIHLSSQKKEQ